MYVCTNKCCEIFLQVEDMLLTDISYEQVKGFVAFISVMFLPSKATKSQYLFS